MSPWVKSLLVLLFAFGVGGSILWRATDGGRVFTSEGARRLRALESPLPVPNVVLRDRHNDTLPLWGRKDAITLVEFIYTTCPTICQSAGAAFARLQEQLDAAKLDADVKLLSVTFDLEHDGPAEMAAYEKWHGADGRQWRVVSPPAAELAPLLKAFGIVVIPDPVFGYQHNAAIHVVNSDGRLVGIFDLEDIEGVVRRLGSMRKGRV
jgi:protein SCO1